MNPKDDPTSLGAILLAMGIINSHQLECAVEEQADSSIEVMLGKLLIANGLISSDQLDMALSAQVGLRSRKRDVKAKAQAAIAEEGSAQVIALAASVREKSSAAKKRATGDTFPAVTAGLLSSKKPT